MRQLTPTRSATNLATIPKFVIENFGRKGLEFAYEVSGLPHGIATIENAFIPDVAVGKFLEATAKMSGENQIGLHLAPHMSIATLGVLGKYVEQSETLGETFARCMQVLPFHSSHDVMSLGPFEDKLKLSYKLVSARAPHYDQIAFCSIGFLINTMREFTGPNWMPDRIGLDIRKPWLMSLFEQTFPCPVYFGEPDLNLVFGRELMNLPHINRPEKKLVTLSDVRRSRAAAAPSSFADVTFNLIRSQLQTSKVDLDTTARLLGFSQRTLQRELDHLGLSFRKMTTHVTMEYADELLRETNMTITDIAEELGYSTHAHFTRAYHKAKEMTPSQFRLV